MHIGFLGHNGFAVGDQSNPLLIDPILEKRYGEEYTSAAVEIYPPRNILVEQLPGPAGILITHEHSDHFHLPSLAKIDRQTPIFVGPTMIESVVKFIRRLGFQVRRLEFGQDEVIGTALVTLYPPHPDTMLWESRVSQLYIRPADHPEFGGIFLGVDALVSQDFTAAIEAGVVPAPLVIALSNNAQITPAGVFGPLDNLNHDAPKTWRKSGFAGLSILSGLVVDTFRQAPSLEGSNILICGGGFLKDYEAMGPFPFAEQDELARLAKVYLKGVEILGPLPGDLLEVSLEGDVAAVGKVPWVVLDAQRFTELRNRRKAFLESQSVIDMRPVVRQQGPSDVPAALAVIETELGYLAQAALASGIGNSLVQAGAKQERGAALALLLLDDELPDTPIVYELNIRCGSFTRLPGAGPGVADAVRDYPYGILVRAMDFAAVLRGDMQIWDIVGVAMKSWYPGGDELGSPVALLYDALGEQVRPDIACKPYQLQLNSLGDLHGYHLLRSPVVGSWVGRYHCSNRSYAEGKLRSFAHSEIRHRSRSAGAD